MLRITKKIEAMRKYNFKPIPFKNIIILANSGVMNGRNGKYFANIVPSTVK